MITDLKPYPEYRQTELPWCTHVPSHWGLVPNRGLIRRRKVLVGDRHTEYQLLSLTKQGVIVRDISTGKGKFSADMGTSQEVRDGDLVFCLFDVPETPRTVGLSRYKGMITGAYTVFESYGKGNPEYLELFYRALDDRKLLSPLYSGLRNTIPAARFLGTKSPAPPLEEQAAIVRFLAWASGRLERAIRAKRKVIALLNEQKKAIIHRAVTRGLDPDVALKPSGVPWLGDVPTHWDVRQLRNIGRLFKGVGGSKEDATLEGVPCVRYGELYFHYKNFISRPNGFVSSEVAASYTPIRYGDVLFAASGERIEEIGKSAVNLFEKPAVCGGDIVILRPAVKVHAAFLGYALDSYSQAYQKATMCRGTTIKHIYPDELRGLYFCLPPIPEQEAITTKLDDELRSSNLALSHLEREIELLSEYRTRLVADVVTGKLDVRGAATKLADDIPIDTTSGEDVSDTSETLDQEASK